MTRITLMAAYLTLGGALLAPALSQAEVSCTRGGLRVENGKLRSVPTLTHLLQANYRGGGGSGASGAHGSSGSNAGKAP